mgnify:CR=1 FL=1
MTGERTCPRQRCGALRSGGNIEEVREKQNLRKRIDREGKERQKWAKVAKAGGNRHRHDHFNSGYTFSAETRLSEKVKSVRCTKGEGKGLVWDKNWD